jgi:hypothetical protein
LPLIQKAHDNLALGNIYLNKGDIPDCGRNRSLKAYLNNPQIERDKYKNLYPGDAYRVWPYGSDAGATDKEMLLLKFTKSDPSGTERPVGVISWYGIHPTDRGQKNTQVCGDNKGYASRIFETSMQMDPSAPETFVAAFANAIAGDVSGNVEFGHIPNGTDDKEKMEKHGRQQYEKAKELFDSAREVLSGSIDYRHTNVDMSCVEIEKEDGGGRVRITWPAALGLSFGAGSREDGVPDPEVLLDEGITTKNITLTEALLYLAGSPLVGIYTGIPTGQDLLEKSIGSFSRADGIEVIAGHDPKPILFALGARDGLAPKVLPIQILKIGQLIITGFPGEITTMAGRRLRGAVLDALVQTEAKHLAMATYANDYSQYVTTKEEYDMQHYEGASTLFGPLTLFAYEQKFRKLAFALRPPEFADLSTLGGGPEASGNPFGYVRSDKINSVVYRGKNNHIYELYRRADSWISGDLSTLAGAPEALGDPAVYVRNDKTNSVVYRGKNNHIYELYLGAGAWHFRDLFAVADWAPAGGASGDPAGYVRSDGTDSVVYRGTDNHIYELYLSAGSWRSADLSTLAGAPEASGDPAGYVRSDKINSVVYRGKNNHIYELYLGAGKWISTDLSGAIGAPAASGDPAGYVRSDKINSIVYRGENTHIYELYLQPGTWICADLSGSIGAPSASGNPAGYVRSDKTNSIVYRGTNNRIYELYSGGDAWHFRDLSAAGVPAASGNPIGYVYSNGRAHSVVYRGENNHICELALRGTWPSWQGYL